ncbi:hypothetical protein [Paenibacillus wynnii]|uniref:hypothetical protein n=1 Tax=Paenibacillus wynnii TaxID=268407 RepID=UPI00279156A8|nr:hypothetical protein [Paenibacillus wynnii]MDQ0193530.1 hypothetical protein [Paenibacillus wynnii]
MLKNFYFIYAAVCACYFGFRYRHSLPEAAVRFVFAVAFPFVGFLFPLFRRHNANLNSPRVEKLESYLRQDAQTDLSKVSRIVDATKEVNIIPLEEALLVNDLTTRRRTMIDLLKQDATDYLEVLRLAVTNEDTETSHYAVSAIVEVKRKLNHSLQDLSVQYESHRDDAFFLEAYAELLQNYMRSGFLDKGTMQRLKYSLAEVLENWIAADPDAFDVYGQKVQFELELGNYAAAEQVSRLFQDRFPTREEPYLALMNLYFTTRSPQQFNQALLSLKQSNVRLSHEGLRFVRFWSEGA